MQKPSPEETQQHGVRTVSAHRLTAGQTSRFAVEDRVAHEDTLSIDIEGVGAYTLMWTPTSITTGAAAYVAGEGVLADRACPEQLELAVGFAYTEGLIGHLRDIATLAVCPKQPDVVRMRLVAPSQVKVRRRNVLLTSSCGVCGSRELLDSTFADMAAVGDTLRVDIADLASLMTRMMDHQNVFSSTGGVHAAAVFSSEKKIVAVAEDLGRHNALDKVIGQRLLREQNLSGCGVVLSSRLSFEMIAKAARAGFEIVAAISAPTSLAIEIAERFGITLCGFVRGECATVYTHPGRIRESAPRA